MKFMKSGLCEEDIADLVNMYLDNIKVDAIAEHFGVWSAFVSKVAHDHGMRRRIRRDMAIARSWIGARATGKLVQRLNRVTEGNDPAENARLVTA